MFPLNWNAFRDSRMRHNVCYDFSILDANKPLSLALFVLQRLNVFWLNRVFFSLQLVLLKHLKLQYKLIHKMNFHLSYPFWLKTTLQCLLNSGKKNTAANGHSKQGIEFYKAWTLYSLPGRNVVFWKYHNDILKQLWWLSGKSPYCHVGSWNLNSSSPWVATLGFLCQNKAAGCAGEEFFVWSQDATLAGGGLCGLAWRGLCSIPAWQNGEDLGAFRTGSRKKVQGKKAEFWFKVIFSFLLNTEGLLTTNGGIKSLTSPYWLKLIFYLFSSECFYWVSCWGEGI